MTPISPDESDLPTEPHRSELASSRRGILLSGSILGLSSLAGCVGSVSSSGPSGINGAELGDEIRAVGEAIRSSVVIVDRGTGWIVEPGVVLTCSHVVGSDSAEITSLGGEHDEARVIGRHESVDIALLETDFTELPPLSLVGQSDPPMDETEYLVQVGHPAAVGTWITSFGEFYGSRSSEVLLDLPCGPGGSGSPIVAPSGDVVGTTLGTTVVAEETGRRTSPNDVYDSFPDQRLVARAAPAAEIERCLDHLL